MRSELSKAVKARFTKRLIERCPQFAETKGTKLPNGSRLYQWRPKPGLCFSLLLQIGDDDRFTVELGWSEQDRWPFFPVTVSPAEKPVNGEMRFRIPFLWGKGGHREQWWELMTRPFDRLEHARNPEPLEQVLPLVEPKVEDAIEHIISDAMPYFQKVLAEHGG